MNLQSFRLKNFRRLKDVHVDLDAEISIFVGANNSGKTSATHGLKKFVQGERSNFSFHDFSASCWADFDRLGDHVPAEGTELPPCPTMSADLWFKVAATDLHRIVCKLPRLALILKPEFLGGCVVVVVVGGKERAAGCRELREDALRYSS